MLLQDILKQVPGMQADKELIKAEIVADAAAEYLDTLDPNHAPIGTTVLARALGGSVDITSRWLRLARSNGLLDGYFTVGKPTRGTFGKPSYKWHAAPKSIKPAMSDDERRAWIKANDPELFNTLYGSRPKPD